MQRIRYYPIAIIKWPTGKTTYYYNTEPHKLPDPLQVELNDKREFDVLV